MERNFKEEEVKATTFSCTRDKIPEPDGYTMAFYQSAGISLKKIFGALNHVHQHCHMAKSSKASFIALIPKKSTNWFSLSTKKEQDKGTPYYPWKV